MTREQLLALLRERHPTWAAAELDPWIESKLQLSAHAVQVGSSPMPDWRRDAAAITCPTLLITADLTSDETLTGAAPLDSIVTPEVAAEAVRINPMLQVAHIEGAGHSIHRDQFDRFLDVVTSFLADVQGRNG
jgi:pimeloyl-ACP methyl ester carboxylesterase